MKKQLMSFAVIGISACILGGCTKKDPVNYDLLNEMVNAHYSQIELSVVDTFDEDTSLESTYTIIYGESSVTVNYSVELFAELSVGGNYTDMKEVKTGSAKFKDGMVVSIVGDNIGLTADVAQLNLSFAKSYFTNFLITDNYLSCDVKNVKAFLGKQIACTDMQVTAVFFELFSSIKISYKSSSGSSVEYTYNFTV